MNALDYWKPHKLEEHGIQQILEARNLFETYGGRLSPSNREVAESLLAYTDEVGLLLNRKRLLARLRLARQYERKAGEVLHKIESMLDP